MINADADADADDGAATGDLAALADLYGVATRYVDADEVIRHPPASTIRAVLAAMDVACADAGEIAASLTAAGERPWRRLVAPTVVVRQGRGRVVRLVRPDDTSLTVHVRLEHGGEIAVDARGHEGARVTLDGAGRTEVMASLPAGVPIGEHRLVVRAGALVDEAHLLVAPDRCPAPPSGAWGWQIQLYALRSRSSWGIGDLGDLSALVATAGAEHGADFVLLNPLHASAPVLPQTDSPYSPSTRRALNPIYLRPEHCDGWAEASAGPDAAHLATARSAATRLNSGERIERDAVFALKDDVLRRLAAVPLPADRAEDMARFRSERGSTIGDVALAFALAGRHGADVRRWPDAWSSPTLAADQPIDGDLNAEIEYQWWLQWQAAEQVTHAQSAAIAAGMRIGLLADLAVGVDAAGADVWSLGADLAAGINVGAPPDLLAQLGQDWGLPPLRPDRLAEHGYDAFRQIVRANIRDAGGLRIDHVMGLWRLFWIPAGAGAADGTYVRYDAEAMLGALALEAARADAVIVGEDLGTVEDGVRESMTVNGVLGSAVFWFEQSASGPDRPARAAEYRSAALTSITTHDLPTVAGWFAGEPTRVRAELGQLARDVDVEMIERTAERDRLLDLLVDHGLLPPGETDVMNVIRAAHAFVARTPSALVAASLADAIGDVRQPNLPGTVDEYPNWRLPVAEPDPNGGDAGTDGLLPPSTPIALDDLLAHPAVSRLAGVMRDGRRRG